MSEFINTIDVLGDDAVMDSLIERSITEFKDDEFTKIADYAFAGCSNLVNIDLPNVVEIGNNVFDGCTGITDWYFPEVLKVGSGAFANNVDILSISLPKATTVGGSLVKSYSQLAEIYMPNVVTMGNMPFQGAKLTNEKVNLSSLENAVYGLFHQAFQSTHVSCLPKAKVLNQYTFGDCGKIESADFPCLTTINNGAFDKDWNLRTLILRNTDGVCTIGNSGLGRTPFDNGGVGGVVLVPSALVESYKTATNWATYYGYGTTTFLALEDYTVDGTTTGELKRCTGIALNTTELTFTDANSQTLTLTFDTPPPYVFDEVIWNSSSSYIAEVNNGVVTPVGDGTAIITVTCGDYSATCTVTVNAGLEITNMLYDIGFNSGYLDGGNGTAKSATSDLYTDKFDISMYAGNPINVQLTNVTTTAANSRMCYYTTDNTFISSVNGVSGGSGIVNMASTVPINATYASISIAKNNNFSINITIDGVLIGEVEYTS